MKKKSFPVTNIGTISLMMVFIILCMVTLAALSLSSAAANSHYGQKISEHTQEYYAASNEAEEILADIDSALAKAYKKTQYSGEYYLEAAKQLPDSVEAMFENGRLVITYQVPINDTQALEVSLSVLTLQQLDSEANSTFYRIRSWQKVETEVWEGDDTLNLLIP